jgi:L-fuconolactonase
MKIDAHQHFWKYTAEEYAWINDEMQGLKRDFLPKDLELEIQQAGFSGSIAVQARQSLDETRWLLSLADQHNIIKGVVGWVDLCSKSIEEQLEEFSQHPKLVGVRHVVQDEPDNRFMLRDGFLNGISLLKKYDLVYDLLIFPRHLPVAIELVKMFPDQTFVLDHIAKPDIKGNQIDPWKDDIIKLASYSNVCCKLSGMVTEADWKKWKMEDFQPYLETVIGTFGSDRLLFGSDWPVCTLAGSYQSVMDIVIEYINKLDQQKSYDILGGNAVRVFNIRIE